MGMGLRGRRGGRARRRKKRRARRRGRGGGGFGKLFLMCCGGNSDPIERNRQEIFELNQAQNTIIVSLYQQGKINVPPNFQQTIGIHVPDHQRQQLIAFMMANARGKTMTVGTTPPSALAPPTGFGPTNAVAPPSAFGATDAMAPPTGFGPTNAVAPPSAFGVTDAVAPPSTFFPTDVPPPTGLYATNSVTPSGAYGEEEEIKCHQSNQTQLLREIETQRSTETDPERLRVLGNQYNQVVQQMKIMESFGFTYAFGVPSMIQGADNNQYAQGQCVVS